MRLDLRNIIHVPDAEKTFQYQMDLSDLDFWGRKPITRPVSVEGSVTNHAGALVLSGTARSELDLVCDRCGKEFSREKVVPLDSLLADKLENEDSEDDIILLDGNELDLDEVVTTAFVLAMDTKNLCSEDCKGLCAKCGADLNLGPCGCRPDVDPRWAKEVSPMAVPKRKVSKARRDKRRSSHWKLETPGIVTCPKCGAYRLPHRMCKNCLTYNGRSFGQQQAETQQQ